MKKRQIEILFRQHYRRMYAAAYGLLYDEQESKDVVSDVFANNKAKTIRLYFEWDQTKSLDENTAILNSFNQIAITRQNNTITIE